MWSAEQWRELELALRAEYARAMQQRALRLTQRLTQQRAQRQAAMDAEQPAMDADALRSHKRKATDQDTAEWAVVEVDGQSVPVYPLMTASQVWRMVLQRRVGKLGRRLNDACVTAYRRDFGREPQFDGCNYVYTPDELQWVANRLK